MKRIAVISVVILFLLQSVFPAMAALPVVDIDGKAFTSLAPMIKQVKHSVVNISTYSTQQYGYNPLLSDPFFRFFFDLPDPGDFREEERRQQSAGSGVIVNSDAGIIMTNYHVIESADEVFVSTIDGRNFKANIVGADPELDIAILEIDADNLTRITLADSSLLEVGDFVVAIGNPFGLGQTVTTGIVSALGRSGLGLEGYENFIQTDASINPGNSGGALVDLEGNLVGINTAIIAPGGGNVGIGFAIPINMAKASMSQIMQYGEVRRGQIGIGIQNINPELREAFNLGNGQSGILVSHVEKGSAAEKSGLKPGDIIIEMDGRNIESTAQLRSIISMKKIGSKIDLVVLRESKQLKVSVKISEPESFPVVDGKIHPLLVGVQFQNNPDGEGVIATVLASNSIAARSGLITDDIIVSINRERVYDTRSLTKILKRGNSSLLMRIYRNGGALYIIIK